MPMILLFCNLVFESCLFKDGLLLKKLFFHMRLYFIATVSEYALVEDIDN